MKNIVLKCLVIAISMPLAYVSCQREMNVSYNGGNFQITVQADVPSADAKTYLGTYQGTDNTVLWGKDEQMQLAVTAGASTVFAQSEKTSAFDGQNRAEFNFMVSLPGADKFTYSGVYPASSVLDADGNTDVAAYKVVLPSVQKATTQTYDPAAYIMSVKPETFDSPQSKWSASFRRAAALNKITLKNISEGIRTVRIVAPGKNLSGVRAMNLTTGESAGIIEGNDAVEVIFNSATASGTFDVWFSSWNATINPGETLQIVASTIEKSYTRTITPSKPISFTEGCLNLLSVDMASATVTDKAPEFTKFTGFGVKPGVRNELVINGVFDSSVDKVVLKVDGFDYETVHTDFYKIENDRAHIYTHVLRVGQRITYALDRGGKYYPFTDIILVQQPDVEDGFIPDAQCKKMLKTERGMNADVKGLGVADMFDVCDMLDVEKARAFKCEDALQISGWGFESLAGFELFDNIGRLGWDQPVIRMWGNGSLKEADFSTFLGYYDINLSSCGNLTRVVAGPNMGGFQNLENNPKLETVDISRGKYITDLQMKGNVPALKLLDLRYQPGGYSMASAGNIDLRGLGSINDYSQLTIKINYEYFCGHNDSRGWGEGVYLAWTRGATVQVYEFGNNSNLLGVVPAYSVQSDALSPENGVKKDGVWTSVNKWSPSGAPSEGFELHTFCQNNMVLQRNQDLVLWGKATEGVKVKAKPSWNSQEYTGQAASDGIFEIRIPVPEAINGNPAQSIQVYNDAKSVTLSNLLIGDVWMLAGQSNMGITLSESENGAQEAAVANHPNMRYFAAAYDASGTPMYDWPKSAGKSWQVVQPSNALWMSALGYYFAKKVMAATNIPVGLVNICMGGEYIRSFYPYDVYNSDPELVQYLGTPSSGRYNSMIYPVLRTSTRGFLWYQGEADWLSYAHYTHAVTKLRDTFRKQFNCPADAPFYLVQLAPYGLDVDYTDKAVFYADNYLKGYPMMREAQAAARKTDKNTEMVCTMDVGDLTNIHPLRKRQVGERLANVALARDYGYTVEYLGPQFRSMVLEDGYLKLSFDHADGLKTTNGNTPSHFYVCPGNGKYYMADAGIHGNQIWLTSDLIRDLKSVENVSIRYCFLFAAECNLVNGNDLPAEPFRTDNLDSVTYVY